MHGSIQARMVGDSLRNQKLGSQSYAAQWFYG